MSKTEKMQLTLSLTEVIAGWWESAQDEIEVPFVGDNLFALMAQSAISALEAVDDAQKYLIANDMMKE